MKLYQIFFLLVFITRFATYVGAQGFQNNWEQPYQKARVFIENKGQFDAFQTPDIGEIAYAIDFGSTRVFLVRKVSGIIS